MDGIPYPSFTVTMGPFISSEHAPITVQGTVWVGLVCGVIVVIATTFTMAILIILCQPASMRGKSFAKSAHRACKLA